MPTEQFAHPLQRDAAGDELRSRLGRPSPLPDPDALGRLEVDERESLEGGGLEHRTRVQRGQRLVDHCHATGIPGRTPPKTSPRDVRVHADAARSAG